MQTVGIVTCNQMTSSTILPMKSFGYGRKRALKGLARSVSVKMELKKEAKMGFLDASIEPLRVSTAVNSQGWRDLSNL